MTRLTEGVSQILLQTRIITYKFFYKILQNWKWKHNERWKKEKKIKHNFLHMNVMRGGGRGWLHLAGENTHSLRNNQFRLDTCKYTKDEYLHDRKTR